MGETCARKHHTAYVKTKTDYQYSNKVSYVVLLLQEIMEGGELDDRCNMSVQLEGIKSLLESSEEEAENWCVAVMMRDADSDAAEQLWS
jgi:hypothetical protein